VDDRSRPAEDEEDERVHKTVRSGLALIAISGLLISCSNGGGSSASGGGTTVAATEKEWEIHLDSTQYSAGPITFNITNDGDKQHEFVIRKTDLQSSALPLNSDGEVVEDSPQLQPAGDPSEVGEIDPGTSNHSITLTLQPGHYVIFCNLHVEDLLHYQKGMHVDFTVS
jgi:uncharacterized cupredoxin-like copper-binding protein